MAEQYAFLENKPVYDSEQLTISTTPVALTAAKVKNTANLVVPRKAAAVLIQAVTNNTVYTLDGTTPSTSNGKRLVAGDILALAGHTKAVNVRFLREGGTDSVIHVDYYA